MLIKENRGLLESPTQHSQKLELHLADVLPPVEADRGQIQQVIMNLVINASDAIDHDDGLIRIVAEEHYLGAEVLSDAKATTIVGDALQPGPYVSLSVEDNSHGMDSTTLEKIFDPFFTTKEAGRGLGLSAVAGIV